MCDLRFLGDPGSFVQPKQITAPISAIAPHTPTTPVTTSRSASVGDADSGRTQSLNIAAKNVVAATTVQTRVTASRTRNTGGRGAGTYLSLHTSQPFARKSHAGQTPQPYPHAWRCVRSP